MDFSSPFSGLPDGQDPDFEYIAQASSPVVSGEVRLTVREHAFTATALFDRAEVPYVSVRALAFADYVVYVETDGGRYAFSRMGSWAQPFYDALRDAYHRAFLRAFFLGGKPILSATGDYCFTENGMSVNGQKASFHVYENCVVALPAEADAVRVPLCFVSGLEKGGYQLTLTLDTGERYTFARLGYDTEPFALAVEKQIRKLHEKAAATCRRFDPTLTTSQTARLARLLLEGAAAPMGRIREIAPSFVAAFEERFSQTRAHDTYKAFLELFDPERICVGIRTMKNAGASDGETPDGEGALWPHPGDVRPDGALLPDDARPDGAQDDDAMLWLIAPSPDGRYAAVEFAADDTATFVYSADSADCTGGAAAVGTDGTAAAFITRLNRALEATGFRREVVRLTEEELRQPGNEDYFMASRRIAPLCFIRENYQGRVIHRSLASWRAHLASLIKRD